MTQTRRTVTTTEEQIPADLILEAWLASLAANPEITKVRVQRRGGDRAEWWSLPPRFHLEPPFDADLEPMYREFGDGEYRFQPATDKGKFLAGARIERVEGYGPGTRGGAGKAPHSVSADMSAEEALSAMRDLIAFQRQQMVLNMLARQNAQMGGMLGGGEPPAGGGPAYEPPDELDRLLKLKMLFDRPDPMAKVFDLIAAVVPSLLQRAVSPPDSADRALDMIDKVMTIRERLAGDGGSDTPWWQQILHGFISTEQGQNLLGGLLGPRGPAPNPPAALPPVAPAAATPPLPRDAAAAQEHFRAQLWPLIESAARRGSEEFGVYADLLDSEMPGLLHTWAQLDGPVALAALENLIGRALDEPARSWAVRFHGYVRENPPASEEEPAGTKGDT